MTAVANERNPPDSTYFRRLAREDVLVMFGKWKLQSPVARDVKDLRVKTKGEVQGKKQWLVRTWVQQRVEPFFAYLTCKPPIRHQ